MSLYVHHCYLRASDPFWRAYSKYLVRNPHWALRGLVLGPVS